ncbi:unnamed protein product, partial [Ixodes pacificus]
DRIDVLIARKLNISRSKVQQLITEGRVQLRDRIVTDNSHIVKINDTYHVTLPEQEPKSESIMPNPNIPLNILHEDDDIVIINKAPGITVHPGFGTEDDTLVNALVAHCGSGLYSVGSTARPGIVHRLDKNTSGLMVVAKNSRAHYYLSKELMGGKFRKEYLALVWGVPDSTHSFIRTNIGTKRTDRTAMKVIKFGGKLAVTEYRVEKTFCGVASVVRCTLYTGRTHQIRVHMSHIGHSIVGDRKYGHNSRKCNRYVTPRKKIREFDRQALHACTLGFQHPSTGSYVEFHSSP